MMDLNTVRQWGAIIISVLALLTFTGTIILAYWIKDPALLNLTVGAAIANSTAAVQYWIGSSAGKQRADEVIAERNNRPIG